MATRKFRSRSKAKAIRKATTTRKGFGRRRHSTAGKILPPLDVRSDKHLSEFKKRITKGPLTIIMVYADWCGHCHTMMPHFDAAAKSAKRSVQAVKVNEQMLPAVNDVVNNSINKSAKPLNVEGYPSIIVVNNKGEKVTDIEPVRNTETMTKVMENAGPLADEAGISSNGVKNGVKNIVTNSVTNTVVNNSTKNIVKNTASMNMNVGEDELKGSIASVKVNNAVNSVKVNNSVNSVKVNNAVKKNNAVNVKTNYVESDVAPSPMNSFPVNNKNINITAPSKEIEKEAEAITSLTAPIAPPSMTSDLEGESISNDLTPAQKIGGGGRRGGSLFSAMSQTAYTLAAPAALLATAAMVMRRKTRKAHKNRRHTRRRR